MMSRHRTTSPDRGLRVADQIQRDLAALIYHEVKDPRIGMVTLTDVEVTPDYAHAKVFYTVLPSDPDTLARTAQGLRRAAPFLRAQLGKRLRIHTIPELRFLHDATPEKGLALSRLIDEAVARQVPPDQDGEGPEPPAVDGRA